MLSRESPDQGRIERFGEARIGDRRRQPECRQLLTRFYALTEAPAEGEKRDLAAFPDDTPLADLERNARLRHLDTDTVAAGIAEGRGPVVDSGSGRHHMHQVCLIRRRHDHEAWQAAEIGDVEGAGMRRSV